LDESILRGRGSDLFRTPVEEWTDQLAGAPEHIGRRLDFMSADHHGVRNFVVRELPRRGQPIGAELISTELDLPLARVLRILDDLEKRLFFVVRAEDGFVHWAFPVTIDPTPHRLVFNTGDRLFGA
jgi:hypothetical protein